MRLEQFSEETRRISEETRLSGEEYEKTLNESNQVMSRRQELLSRFKLLSEMQRDYEGYNSSVKQVLLEARRRGMNSVHGVVANIIHADKNIEKAIETALGPALQNIVVDTEEDARELIEFLKQNRFGRATFLPISAVRGRTLDAGERNLLRMPGGVGVASEMVTFDSKYRGIVDSLLGRTVIAEDLQKDIPIHRAGRQQFRLVTLDGDVMNVGGSMTGGSSVSRMTSLLSREREINETEQTLKELENKLNAYQEKLNLLSRSRAEMKMQRQEAFDAFHQQEIAVTRAEAHLSRAGEEKAAWQQRLDSIVTDIASLKEQKQRIEEDLERLSHQTDSTREESERMREEAARLQRELNEKRLRLDGLRTEATERLVRLTALEKDGEKRAGEIERLKAQAGSAETLLRQTEEQLKQIDLQAEQDREELKKQETLLGKTRGSLDETRAEFNAADKLRLDAQEQLRSVNAKLEELQSQHPEFYGEDVDTEYHTMTLKEAAGVFPDPRLDVQKLLTDVGFYDFDHVMMTMPVRHAVEDIRITQENLNAWKINAVYYLCNDLGYWYTQELEDASVRFTYCGNKALYGGAYTLEDYLGWFDYDSEDEASADSEEDPFEVAIYDIAGPLLPYDIARLWCEYYYSTDTTEDVLALVEDIMLAYRARFEANEWLDDETRANAEKKLDNLMVFLGYRDDDSAEILSRAEGGTFFRNACSINANDLQKTVRICVDKKYYRELVFIDFDSVNAYYVPSLNSITIPAGILGGVFYGPDIGYAKKLGAIGMVVGHEIGHAFDRSGSQYDENGAKVNWWSEEAAATYNALMDRFLTYYGSYDAIGGVVQDVDLTIEENMADFAAMTVITDILADDPEGQRVALEAYAALWGEILTEDRKYFYLDDEHAANQVRVNAIVSSLDCFYELYDIREDDPMYVAPEDRLQLW